MILVPTKDSRSFRIALDYYDKRIMLNGKEITLYSMTQDILIKIHYEELQSEYRTIVSSKKPEARDAIILHGSLTLLEVLFYITYDKNNDNIKLLLAQELSL